MVISLQYIFGCSHSKRRIHSTAIFERGFEIPAAYCEDCVDEKHLGKSK